MENLIFNSLEIRNFRAFRHLRIERLGRVNLIVGRNSVGKTCLLEALSLYAQRGTPSAIWHILETRDEARRPSITDLEDPYYLAMRATDSIDSIKHLFHGRRNINQNSEQISIGEIQESNDTLLISAEWRNFEDDEEYQLSKPILDISIGKHGISYDIDDRFSLKDKIPFGIKEIRHIFISSSGLHWSKINNLWDSISLTDLEQDILNSLRIIAPEIDRINLIGNKSLDSKRIPIVRMNGTDTPVPLLSIGEGLIRIFSIALAIVNTRNGLLLIDEIESGLHYSAQLDLWRLIFQVAHRLNVQVFATTHSWDCIEAFQQAAQEDQQEEGMLIRLGRKKGDIVATLFDEQELAIVTREQIEVR